MSFSSLHFHTVGFISSFSQIYIYIYYIYIYIYIYIYTSLTTQWYKVIILQIFCYPAIYIQMSMSVCRHLSIYLIFVCSYLSIFFSFFYLSTFIYWSILVCHYLSIYLSMIFLILIFYSFYYFISFIYFLCLWNTLFYFIPTFKLVYFIFIIIYKSEICDVISCIYFPFEPG